MDKLTTLCLLLALVHVGAGETLYEYYAPGGVISSGLEAQGATFTLNGKDITILSGSFHYFRVHPDYWQDTLRKFRAAGLNAITLYVPWNLHEPREGVYDFGNLGADMSAFLDIRRFIQLAQQEDLLVLFRPGPYICSEWEFGGMPSWLLRDHTMHVRTYYQNFRFAAQAYYEQLLPLVADLQFTRGGSIIAIQIENEYGGFGFGDEPRDKLYLEYLKSVILANGFDDSLLFTSDGTANYLDWGSLPGVLQMSNFKYNAEENLNTLLYLQPDRPRMVAEFWTGWFDHWLADIHQDWNVEDFATTYEQILTMNSSVNMYMFIGGTNFGFMAGANAVDSWPHYAPIVTSYDYGSPLSEGGDYSEKYDRVVEILSRLNPLNGIVDNPPAPAEREKGYYGNFSVSEFISFSQLVSQTPDSFLSEDGPLNMEALPINDGNGQSYGYLLYSTTVDVPSVETNLTIRGYVRDMAQVMLDGELITEPYQNFADVNGFGFWNGRDQSLTLPALGTTATLDILVENLGRVNYGSPLDFQQKKGLWEGNILLGREILNQWTMTPLEFKSAFVNGLTDWQPFVGATGTPAVYKATVDVGDTPLDTYLDMRGWGKGVVFVNGFNLGRFWSPGPTRTLYVPGALLNAGENTFTVFEQYDPASSLSFIDYPVLS